MQDETFEFPQLIELGSLHELTLQVGAGKAVAGLDALPTGPSGKVSGDLDGAGFGGAPT